MEKTGEVEVYEETLLWKQRWVEDALERIGKISVQIKPIIGTRVPWRYRNKARLHRVPTGKLGYYKEKSKELIHFSDCLLLSEQMNRWVRHLPESPAGEEPRSRSNSSALTNLSWNNLKHVNCGGNWNYQW